jgi:class 3 adenylate cyclase
LGQDDLHEVDFDYLEEVYHFSEVNKAKSRLRISKTAVPLNDDFCPLSLHLYPSKDLHVEHVTGRPTVFAFATFLAFIFVGLVSMTYDCVIQRRTRFILKHAKENRSLVASLFPEAFRQRLLHDDEELDPVSSALAPSKVRLKSLLAKSHMKMKDSSMSDDDPLFAKPIADLFPHCTVLFADVSGFSAWSSERSPVQVFTLLETLFQALDRVARRRRVFKVETVGDSYVAATGLPDPQPDHVVRIARFARDILTTVNDLTKQLEATLGPDTGELKMRLGIHSGQVTAGVLRGEKERFQLFGDTMNMASRMESTGVKNRIQVSPVSAQLLIEAGKESWIIPREEQVQAKGKGVVQTYWMVNRANIDDNQSISSVSRVSSTDYQTPTTLGGFDQQESLWDDSVHNAALKHSSRRVKTKRLVNWLTEVISNDLKRLVAMRTVKQLESRDIENATSAVAKKDMPLSEVVESFTMPTFKPNTLLTPSDVDSVELPKDVVEELRDFVSRISRWYRFNPFHNFEHASHVAACLLSSCSVESLPMKMPITGARH